MLKTYTKLTAKMANFNHYVRIVRNLERNDVKCHIEAYFENTVEAKTWSMPGNEFVTHYVKMMTLVLP